jgi:hypothetical protein
MKNKQLLIAVATIAFYSMNLVATTNIQALRTLESEHDSLVAYRCLKVNQACPQCDTLSLHYKHKIEHDQNKKTIDSLQEQLSASKDPHLTKLLTNRLNKEIAKCPGYNKTYLQTLTEDQTNELFNAMETLVKEDISVESLSKEYSKLRNAFNN